MMSSSQLGILLAYAEYNEGRQALKTRLKSAQQIKQDTVEESTSALDRAVLLLEGGPGYLDSGNGSGSNESKSVGGVKWGTQVSVFRQIPRLVSALPGRAFQRLFPLIEAIVRPGVFLRRPEFCQQCGLCLIKLVMSGTLSEAEVRYFVFPFAVKMAKLEVEVHKLPPHEPHQSIFVQLISACLQQLPREVITEECVKTCTELAGPRNAEWTRCVGVHLWGQIALHLGGSSVVSLVLEPFLVLCHDSSPFVRTEAARQLPNLYGPLILFRRHMHDRLSARSSHVRENSASSGGSASSPLIGDASPSKDQENAPLKAEMESLQSALSRLNQTIVMLLSDEHPPAALALVESIVTIYPFLPSHHRTSNVLPRIMHAIGVFEGDANNSSPQNEAQQKPSNMSESPSSPQMNSPSPLPEPSRRIGRKKQARFQKLLRITAIIGRLLFVCWADIQSSERRHRDYMGSSPYLRTLSMPFSKVASGRSRSPSVSQASSKRQEIATTESSGHMLSPVVGPKRERSRSVVVPTKRAKSSETDPPGSPSVSRSGKSPGSRRRLHLSRARRIPSHASAATADHRRNDPDSVSRASSNREYSARGPSSRTKAGKSLMEAIGDWFGSLCRESDIRVRRACVSNLPILVYLYSSKSYVHVVHPLLMLLLADESDEIRMCTASVLPPICYLLTFVKLRSQLTSFRLLRDSILPLLRDPSPKVVMATVQALPYILYAWIPNEAYQRCCAKRMPSVWFHQASATEAVSPLSSSRSIGRMDGIPALSLTVSTAYGTPGSLTKMPSRNGSGGSSSSGAGATNSGNDVTHPDVDAHAQSDWFWPYGRPFVTAQSGLQSMFTSEEGSAHAGMPHKSGLRSWCQPNPSCKPPVHRSEYETWNSPGGNARISFQCSCHRQTDVHTHGMERKHSGSLSLDSSNGEEPAVVADGHHVVIVDLSADMHPVLLPVVEVQETAEATSPLSPKDMTPIYRPLSESDQTQLVSLEASSMAVLPATELRKFAASCLSTTLSFMRRLGRGDWRSQLHLLKGLYSLMAWVQPSGKTTGGKHAKKRGSTGASGSAQAVTASKRSHEANELLRSLMKQQCESGSPPVRMACCLLMARYVFRLKHPREQVATVRWLVDTFANAKSFRLRQVFVRICFHFLVFFSISWIHRHVLNPMLKLSRDRLPRVCHEVVHFLLLLKVAYVHVHVLGRHFTQIGLKDGKPRRFNQGTSITQRGPGAEGMAMIDDALIDTCGQHPKLDESLRSCLMRMRRYLDNQGVDLSTLSSGSNDGKTGSSSEARVSVADWPVAEVVRAMTGHYATYVALLPRKSHRAWHEFEQDTPKTSLSSLGGFAYKRLNRPQHLEFMHLEDIPLVTRRGLLERAAQFRAISEQTAYVSVFARAWSNGFMFPRPGKDVPSRLAALSLRPNCAGWGVANDTENKRVGDLVTDTPGVGKKLSTGTGAGTATDSSTGHGSGTVVTRHDESASQLPRAISLHGTGTDANYGGPLGYSMMTRSQKGTCATSVSELLGEEAVKGPVDWNEMSAWNVATDRGDATAATSSVNLFPHDVPGPIFPLPLMDGGELFVFGYRLSNGSQWHLSTCAVWDYLKSGAEKELIESEKSGASRRGSQSGTKNTRPESSSSLSTHSDTSSSSNTVQTTSKLSISSVGSSLGSLKKKSNRSAQRSSSSAGRAKRREAKVSSGSANSSSARPVGGLSRPSNAAGMNVSASSGGKQRPVDRSAAAMNSQTTGGASHLSSKNVRAGHLSGGDHKRSHNGSSNVSGSKPSSNKYSERMELLSSSKLGPLLVTSPRTSYGGRRGIRQKAGDHSKRHRWGSTKRTANRYPQRTHVRSHTSSGITGHSSGLGGDSVLPGLKHSYGSHAVAHGRGRRRPVEEGHSRTGVKSFDGNRYAGLRSHSTHGSGGSNGGNAPISRSGSGGKRRGHIRPPLVSRLSRGGGGDYQSPAPVQSQHSRSANVRSHNAKSTAGAKLSRKPLFMIASPGSGGVGTHSVAMHRGSSGSTHGRRDRTSRRPRR